MLLLGQSLEEAGVHSPLSLFLFASWYVKDKGFPDKEGLWDGQNCILEEINFLSHHNNKCHSQS